jgi:lon-related putative ATP-dependent protease
MLRWQCDPQQLPFASAAEPRLCEVLPQDRARGALAFGTAIERHGYNIYVLGSSGSGKRTLVQDYLKQKAASEQTPDDWCYVNNFPDPGKPRAIALPAGRGLGLQKDVEVLIDDLGNSIPAALESDEHKHHVKEIVQEAEGRQNQALQELGQKCMEQQIQLVHTPGGFVLAPLRDSEVLSPEEFQKLPAEERSRIEQAVVSLQGQLHELLEQFPKWHKETRDRIKELNREAARLAIGHLMEMIRQRYADLPQAVQYFHEMERDIIERVDEFQPAEESPAVSLGLTQARNPSFDDYALNLLVDHSGTRGAPVIYEDHPSYHNLIGRVEHISEMGTLVTDFSLIKAGALHRANGGYLILDVRSLLQQPFAWEALLRALKARSVKIESLGESLSLISTVSLEPQPIPLDAKVVLLGDRLLYYLLYAYEPGFAELFKVAADFDEHIDRTPENCQRLASFLASLARHEHTRDLDRTGMARLMEHAARVAEDSEKLSVHARTLADVLQEADHWAGHEASAVIQDRHVRQAIEQQIQRADRVRQRIYEEIQRGSILIDTEGTRVGQVNGLSLIDLGNFCFGQPSRITATARLGRGEVIDIEREVKLGGALHSKGVLILSSFLASQYASNRPLSLSASLVFEQTYGMVEGDSASLAELCALLSALAGIGVQQSLAVTGSVNQLGQVQAIGGVNQKIEGFFDVCRRRGLTSNQGVLIPRSNLPHLMLREDVVEAAAAGNFRVFAVRTVDEAMSLLTGIPAGQRDAAGNFPEGSVNRRIESRLQELTDLRIQFGREQSPAAKAAQDES